ncbi:uncharacterized protein N7479_009699 [Penicillium vulpinum]|uniref:DUF6536 domain-containing protein n=1 Tax=Penicillium vulpinum TaxID=29845 RepID=A0A1V6RFY9_9EURO|nr:uncharacterized protein N7479_009699 [Penicillium vulpinum]KAJ5951286.1 hypothetical protein N7479_009699 [Penicillium vulpinum]OQE00414.1 hypothetical protein PENVUL_c052G03391 [Penicillium vulpinum]
MWNRALINRDTELISIPSPYKSADPLIQNTSERESERYSERDTEKLESKPKRSWPFHFGDRFQGWKFTIFLACMTSLIVFLFNLIFMLYTISHDRQDDTVGILYEGDCKKVHHLDLGFHLLINVLSTALVSASNFGMQCLAAPTRQNIDRAHQKGKWLDIGVPSIRNLFHVSKGRSLLWICLAFSSLPFHLIYNSTIFSTTSVTAYSIFLGNGDLEKIASPDLEGPLPGTDKLESFNRLSESAKSKSLKRLEPQECVDNYAQRFQTTYGNLILATEQMPTNATYIYLGTQDVYIPTSMHLEGDTYRWLCPPHRSNDCAEYLPTIQSQIKQDNWTMISSGSSRKIDYCLAERVEQFCKLQYSFPLVMVIIAFNLFKAAILCYMWFSMSEAPILTIGDAIASFLRRPDPYTKGRCLLDRKSGFMLSVLSGSIKKWPPHEPRKYVGTRKRWSSAVSRRRWLISISFCIMVVLACFGLFIFVLTTVSGPKSIWTANLGSIDAASLITGDHWPKTLIPNVIIANLPQLTLSFLYFAFNSLLTTMTIAAEWSSYAINRKGLRVSGSPSLSQRSSYFLSLPYRYAIPLVVVSSLLHWLLSRTLFVVSVEAYDPNMKRQQIFDLLKCGYSLVGHISTLGVGVFMVSCLIGVNFKRFKSGMPVVGSCSFAISAACHPAFDPNREFNEAVDAGMESENDDQDMALLPVQWGSVPVVGPMGHCSFTSEDVTEPHEEKEYL